MPMRSRYDRPGTLFVAGVIFILATCLVSWIWG